MTDMSPIEGARFMVARGYPVFPCAPGSKVPKRKNWRQHATKDPEHIEAIFSGAMCNVGVPTDNHLVVDVDTHKGHGEWPLLNQLPKTLTIRTPRGGLHYHYELPAGAAVGCSVEKIGPGIDVRSNGGLVIVPGSTVDGRPYTVDDDAPIAVAPLWLLELCQGRTFRKSDIKAVGELDTVSAIDSARTYLESAAPPAIEGSGGNETTYKVACRVKDRGVLEQACFDLMLEHYNPRCSPEWSYEELESIVSNVYRYGQAPAGRDNPASGFSVADIPAPASDTAHLLEFSSEVTRDDILAASLRDIVKGLVAPGMSATLYGETGVGKSHIALDLAYHVAHGREYHGLKTRKVPVLYVQLEGVAGFRKRILATTEKYGDPGSYFARLKVQVSLAKDANGATGAETIVRAVKYLKEKTGADSCLVIIDTKARATAGDNENDGADMSAFAEKRQGYIARETDACVLVVHHPNKGGEYRGHSAQKAGDDLVLKVEKGRVIAEKVKDHVEGPFFDFTLKQVGLGADADGFAVTTCVVEKQAAMAMSTHLPAAKREAKEVAVLREAFGSVAREMHVRDGDPKSQVAPMLEIRDAFSAAYVSRHADATRGAVRTAWSRARKKLPPEFKIGKAKGAEIMWREEAVW